MVCALGVYGLQVFDPTGLPVTEPFGRGPQWQRSQNVSAWGAPDECVTRQPDGARAQGGVRGPEAGLNRMARGRASDCQNAQGFWLSVMNELKNRGVQTLIARGRAEGPAARRSRRLSRYHRSEHRASEGHSLHFCAWKDPRPWDPIRRILRSPDRHMAEASAMPRSRVQPWKMPLDQLRQARRAGA